MKVLLGARALRPLRKFLPEQVARFKSPLAANKSSS
jgi:hypothetical protein